MTPVQKRQKSAKYFMVWIKKTLCAWLARLTPKASHQPDLNRMYRDLNNSPAVEAGN